jgi:hypothetical protein
MRFSDPGGPSDARGLFLAEINVWLARVGHKWIFSKLKIGLYKIPGKAMLPATEQHEEVGMRTNLLTTVAVVLFVPPWSLAADSEIDQAHPPAPTADSPAVFPPGGSITAEPPQPPAFFHRELGNAYASLGEGVVDYYNPPGCFAFHAEYLLWAIKGDHLPPLATLGAPGSGAVAGQPGVSTIFGGGSVDHNPYSGVRAWADIWFDTCYTLGIEVGYMFLADQAVRSTTGSSGDPNAPDLARPFFNATTGQNDSLLVASAGVSSGYITTRADTSMQGLDALGLWSVCRNRNFSLELLGGIRFLELDDSVDVTEASILNILPVISTISADHFTVRNHYFGAELGARSQLRFGSLQLTLTEKVVLGDDAANVEIAGGTFQASPLGPGVGVGAGVLAQPSNIGKHSANSFGFVNESTLQLGWNFNEYLQMFVGYSVLYASSVLRAGDAIDFTVNPNQAFGATVPARPLFTPQTHDFLANGFNVGMELRF